MEVDNKMKKDKQIALALKLPVLVLDIETRQSAQEVGGWRNKQAMEISVAVVYDNETNTYESYGEEEIGALMTKLTSGKPVVGFNLIDFDYHILAGAMRRAKSLPIDVAYLARQLIMDWPEHIPTIDLLQFIAQDAGRKISLDSLAQATLKAEKSGSGLEAIELWKNGEIEKLTAYCQQDVDLTYALYIWGLNRGTYWWFTKDYKVKWGYATWLDTVIKYAQTHRD
jgi:DEAD/DEAH box helicase domain-containing protein